MALNGTITHISRSNGMFIVRIDEGDCVVFELLDGIDLQVGQLVRGNLTGLGGETLTVVDDGTDFEAFGQSGPSSLNACLKLL